MDNFSINRDKLKKALLGTEAGRKYTQKRGIAEKVVGLPSQVTEKVTGKLKIEKIPADGGETEVLVDEENLVVTQAETILPFMSAGIRSINYIELGDQVTPSAPADANIALDSTTAERKATVFSASGNAALYVSTFGVGDGNGFIFTEAGLFTDPFAAGSSSFLGSAFLGSSFLGSSFLGSSFLGSGAGGSGSGVGGSGISIAKRY